MLCHKAQIRNWLIVILAGLAWPGQVQFRAHRRLSPRRPVDKAVSCRRAGQALNRQKRANNIDSPFRRS